MNRKEAYKTALINKGWEFANISVKITDKRGIIHSANQISWCHTTLCPNPVSFTKAKEIAFPPLAQLNLFNYDGARLFISE